MRTRYKGQWIIAASEKEYNGRGAAIYLSPMMKKYQGEWKTYDHRLVRVDLNLPNATTIIAINLYAPAKQTKGGSHQVRKWLEAEFTRAARKYESGKWEIILMGDFNEVVTPRLDRIFEGAYKTQDLPGEGIHAVYSRKGYD